MAHKTISQDPSTTELPGRPIGIDTHIHYILDGMVDGVIMLDDARSQITRLSYFDPEGVGLDYIDTYEKWKDGLGDN